MGPTYLYLHDLRGRLGPLPVRLQRFGLCASKVRSFFNQLELISFSTPVQNDLSMINRFFDVFVEARGVITSIQNLVFQVIMGHLLERIDLI